MKRTSKIVVTCAALVAAAFAGRFYWLHKEEVELERERIRVAVEKPVCIEGRDEIIKKRQMDARKQDVEERQQAEEFLARQADEKSQRAEPNKSSTAHRP